MAKRLVLLGLVIALAITIGFFTFRPADAVVIVRYAGYWYILITAGLFGLFLYRSVWINRLQRAFLQRPWRPIVFCALAAAFLHIHERHELKIVADEVLLQLTAQRMHQSREAAVVLRGYDYAGNFHPIASYVDKRPLFFPFLLSAIHDLTGYRVGNVYFLNALLSFVLVLLLWKVVQRIGGSGAATAAVVLLVGVPLVAQNACGSGFELLNLVMILASLWLGMRLVERPDDEDRLSAFVLAGALLAQVRYESVIFIVPVGVTVLYAWWRAKKIVLPAAVIATPLLLSVVPLHFNVFKVMESTWQLNDVAGSDHVFGLRYFYDNVGHALNFFFSFDGEQPSSWLLALLGIFGSGFFVLILYQQHARIFREEPVRAVFCIFAIGLLLHTALMLLYFWGHWDDPIIRRLSLPAHLLLIFGFVYSWPHLVPHRHRWRIVNAAGVLFLIAFSIPAMAAHKYTQQNFAARSYNWIAPFIEKLDERPVLAIDQSTGLQWFLYGKSVVALPAVASRPESFLYHFKHRSFADYFVVQRAGVDAKTGERWTSFNDDLGDGVTLQLIEERAFSPVYLMRFSRIVAVDEDKFRAWAADNVKKRKDLATHTTANTAVAISPSGSAEADQVMDWLKNLP